MLMSCAEWKVSTGARCAASMSLPPRMMTGTQVLRRCQGRRGGVPCRLTTVHQNISGTVALVAVAHGDAHSSCMQVRNSGIAFLP